MNTRPDGPAVEHPDSPDSWYNNCKSVRTGRPAVIEEDLLLKRSD